MTAAISDGRPVITAMVPTEAARRRMAGAASGCASVAAGSTVIGASVPSKSRPISARTGLATMAASPSRPAAVAGTGSSEDTGSGNATAGPYRPRYLPDAVQSLASTTVRSVVETPAGAATTRLIAGNWLASSCADASCPAG